VSNASVGTDHPPGLFFELVFEAWMGTTLDECRSNAVEYS